MDENIIKADMKVLEIVKNSLIRNGFDCHILENKNDLKRYLIDKIGSGKKVGAGGSMSLAEIGGLDIFGKNNTIFTHRPEMNIDERRKIWLDCMDSDFYIASPQAVTYDGKMIFIDGTGNRCAAITWGPREIILIVGKNKIVRNQDEGLWRARNISAIRNNIRLGKRNPCVVSGKCEDCYSNERICNIITILWKRPKVSKITVLLVNEELGY